MGVVSGMCEQQKLELLDSMCDEIVARIGEAYMLGFDIEGALDDAILASSKKISCSVDQPYKSGCWNVASSRKSSNLDQLERLTSSSAPSISKPSI